MDHVVLHVTDRCNLNCQHCLRDPGGGPLDLPLETIVRVLDQLVAYRIKSVSLTGGEPLLHPQLSEIVDAIVARELGWSIICNASRFEDLAALLRERKERRAALKFVGFSLDGATEETHDRIRGAGSHLEVMRAIARCVADEIPFALQMAINRANRHEIEAYGLQAAQLGADFVRYSWTQPTGTHYDATLRLSPREWVTVRDTVARMKDVLRVDVDSAAGFPMKVAFVNCGVWSNLHPHLTADGQYSLCCALSGTPGESGLSDRLGDAREVPLSEAHLRMSDLVNELRKRRIRAIHEGEMDPWDELPCNWCAKQFGRPHWTKDGVGGGEAERPRWRGAWAGGATGARPGSRVRLPVVDK
ncbi:MAG: radical SAM protein [Sandaracinaceae bacterium]|nr:radical SAM protein [Sandaracinaceae bacterium]